MFKIVLVEDNRGDQRLFEEAIKEIYADCQLRIASNGKDGLALIKQETPDLLVLDLLMPGMSGYDVYSALRFDHAHRNPMPILLITGHKEDIDPRVGEAKKLYYLQKPYNPSQLKQMIDRIRAVNLPK